MALGKGKASKSSSGASMSAYDVEVEARLKVLEAKVKELETQEAGNDAGVAQVSNDSTEDHERLLNIEADLNRVRGVLGI